ncbi:MAG: hypothetical protein IKN38_08370, partial [Clostridia bacterium]|nr:hypothetical protein [Clostridia bacterium]
LALVFYLHYEAPPEEQNFPMVMEMIRAGEVREALLSTARRHNDLELKSETLIKTIKSIIANKVQGSNETPRNDTVLSLAPVLKKAAKEYGYTYVNSFYRFYRVEKTTSNSHILTVEMDTGRCGNELNVELALIGAGFKTVLDRVSFAPGSQDEVKNVVFSYFEAIKSIETGALDQLDRYFPKSPAYYMKMLSKDTV